MVRARYTTRVEPFSEYLQTRMKQLGLGQRQLATMAGVSHTAINLMLKGVTAHPTHDTCVKLAGPLRTSPEEVLRQAGYDVSYLPSRTRPAPPGADYGRQPITAHDEAALPPGAIPVGAMVAIPIVGHVSAGVPILAAEHIVGWEQTPMERVANGQYFYLRVQGDSMMGDGIRPGGLVLVRAQADVPVDAIALVMVDGDEATIKRVRVDGDRVMLYGSNPDYLPTVHDPADVRIIGRVVEYKVKFE